MATLKNHKTRSFYRFHKSVRKTFSQPSLAKQEMRRECDINHIMAKYQRTGLVTHLAQNAGQYRDLANAVDFETAMNVITDASRAFGELPSDVRAHFRNDPQELLRALDDPKRVEELQQLGLVEISRSHGPSSQASNSPADSDVGSESQKDPGKADTPPGASKARESASPS